MSTGELIPFKLAANWLEKLAKNFKDIREEKIAELAPISDELMVSPKDLAPVFVEPDLQPYNPADDIAEYEDEHRVPAFRILEGFIKARKVNPDGGRQMFILADAGMGKTSILAMFKLAHVNALWPSGYECLPIKLGPDTLDRLKEVTNR